MERDPKQPRDLYNVLYPIAKMILDSRYSHVITNQENILDEPAIYAANHISAFDSPLISEAYTETTGLPLRFVMKEGYANGTGVDDKGKHGRLAKIITKHTLQIPVSREGNSLEEYKLFHDRVAQTLERGDSIGIHPEGTRSKTESLLKFKTGAARPAIANHVPIVPVGIVYFDIEDSKKTGANIIFGKPVTPRDLERIPYTLISDTKNKASYLTQIIEHRVSELTNLPQYEDFARMERLRDEETH
jgi:1-acyl-sn-glycerol-3-phosphate acyltransferase